MGEDGGEIQGMDAGEVAAVEWLRTVAGQDGTPQKRTWWYSYSGLVSGSSAGVTIFWCNSSLMYYTTHTTKIVFVNGRLVHMVRKTGDTQTFRLQYRDIDGKYEYDDRGSMRSLTIDFDRVLDIFGKNATILVEKPWNRAVGWPPLVSLARHPAYDAVALFRRDFRSRCWPNPLDLPPGWKCKKSTDDAIEVTTTVDGAVYAIEMQRMSEHGRGRITFAQFKRASIEYLPLETTEHLALYGTANARFVVSVVDSAEVAQRAQLVSCTDYPFPDNDWDGAAE